MAHIVAGEHGFAGELATTGHGPNPSFLHDVEAGATIWDDPKSLATAARDIRGLDRAVKAAPQTCFMLGIDESGKYPDICGWEL
jgi:hypothetical protein